MTRLGALLATALWLTTSSASARIATEPIRTEIVRHLPAIRGCYEEGLARRRDLAGRIEVVFAIEADGRVSDAQVQRSTLADAAVEACVLAELRTMRFPTREGDPVRIHYPFLFSPGG